MTLGWHISDEQVNISTHILTKRMTSMPQTGYSMHIFQLTSSRRGWLYQGFHYKHHLYNFNSHPHEEDDHNKGGNLQALRYFNSHPHEEDDILDTVQNNDEKISTHILTKRMTYPIQHLPNQNSFQLTSSRRGWLLRRILPEYHPHFNSHPHEEDDLPNAHPLLL